MSNGLRRESTKYGKRVEDQSQTSSKAYKQVSAQTPFGSIAAKGQIMACLNVCTVEI